MGLIMDISEMSKDQLESAQVVKELELQSAIRALSIVEEEDNNLAVEVAKLQLKRKELGTALIQGKSNQRRVSSELRNLKTMLFRRIAGL